jgi:hypothetical protein
MNLGQLFTNCALRCDDVSQSVARYIARSLSISGVIYLINAEIKRHSRSWNGINSNSQVEGDGEVFGSSACA